MRRNKIILTLVFLFSSILFTITSCNSGGENSKGADLPPGMHCVGVIQVIQTTNYTYLQVEENDNKFWIAVVKREAKSGEVIYYTKAYEMKDFVSKELGRTFPTVFFVQDPSEKLRTDESPAPQNISSGKNEINRRVDISVETPKGGITISDLYKNRDKYAGQTVKIRGVVVKYNKQIMHKNWIHIQDGTDYSGKFDLTVTSMDSVQVGNTVTFKGIIRLNKDFGAGYVYDVIMEEAKASDIKPTK